MTEKSRSVVCPESLRSSLFERSARFMKSPGDLDVWRRKTRMTCWDWCASRFGSCPSNMLISYVNRAAGSMGGTRGCLPDLLYAYYVTQLSPHPCRQAHEPGLLVASPALCRADPCSTVDAIALVSTGSIRTAAPMMPTAMATHHRAAVLLDSRSESDPVGARQRTNQGFS